MEKILIAVIIIINLIAVIMLIKKSYGCKQKQLVIISSIIGMYIIVNIIYLIASIGMPNTITFASKNFIIFSLLPLNIIAIISPIVSLISKRTIKEISDEEYSKRLKRILILDAIIIAVECVYIRNIQFEIIKMLQK